MNYDGIVFKPDVDDVFIEHFGIKGMKWGIRKDPYKSGSGGIFSRLSRKKQKRGSRVQTITFNKSNFSSKPKTNIDFGNASKHASKLSFDSGSSSRHTPKLIFDTTSYKKVENKKISNFGEPRKDLWKQINLQNTGYKTSSIDDFTSELLKKNAARLKAYGY